MELPPPEIMSSDDDDDFNKGRLVSSPPTAVLETTTLPSNGLLSPSMISIDIDSITSSPALSNLKPSSNIDRLKRWAWQATLILVPTLTGLDTVMTTAGNAAFSGTIGSIFWAVAFTYTIAALICLLWTFFTARESFPVVIKKVHVWIADRPTLSNKWLVLCGGLCGASQNVIGALVTKHLGSAVYSLAMLVGTIVTSSFIDHFGLVWTTRRPIRWMSIVGTLVLTAGCVMYRLGSWIGDSDDEATPVSTGMTIVYICLAIFCGFTAAFQGPFGGQLGRITGQFRWAASWSFLSGLVPIIILAFAISGLPEWKGMTLPDEWYSLLPGILVIESLFVTAWFPRHLPVATVWCLLICGQILSSAVLDTAGWVGLDKRSLDWWSVGGIVLVLMGITVIALMKIQKSATTIKKPEPSFTSITGIERGSSAKHGTEIESRQH